MSPLEQAEQAVAVKGEQLRAIMRRRRCKAASEAASSPTAASSLTAASLSSSESLVSSGSSGDSLVPACLMDSATTERGGIELRDSHQGCGGAADSDAAVGCERGYVEAGQEAAVESSPCDTAKPTIDTLAESLVAAVVEPQASLQIELARHAVRKAEAEATLYRHMARPSLQEAEAFYMLDSSDEEAEEGESVLRRASPLPLPHQAETVARGDAATTGTGRQDPPREEVNALGSKGGPTALLSTGEGSPEQADRSHASGLRHRNGTSDSSSDSDTDELMWIELARRQVAAEEALVARCRRMGKEGSMEAQREALTTH